MFKIADSTQIRTVDPFFELDGCLTPEMMDRYAVTEDWQGDLSNGVMRLGERAAMLHELPDGECGLLTMMRRYDPQDRGRILQLFEQAAAASSQFCYTTTIRQSGDRRQPIFCIGQSREMDSCMGASMTGIFIFPRFRTEQPLLASQS